MFRCPSDRLRLPDYDSEQGFIHFYYCDICNDGGWDSETELAVHRSSKHRAELKKRSCVNLKISKRHPVCRVCIKNFESSSELLQHIKSDHLHSSPTARRIERQIFICDLCLQIFFNKRLLELHVVHRHMKARVPCPICPKDLHRKSMWSHLEYHKLRSVSTCPICLKKRHSWLDLKQHIQTHAKYLACEACGYRTNKEESFNQHIEKYRLKDTNMNVNVNLRKVFLFPLPHKINFIRNVIKGVTIANQLYICTLCREICTSKSSMMKHVKRVHVKLEPKPETKHACVCGEEFERAIFLKLHMLKSNCGKEEATDSPDPDVTISLDSTDKEEVISKEGVISMEEVSSPGIVSNSMDLTENVCQPSQNS